MRLAIDTGGTFTDLVVEMDDGRIALHKRPTTPTDPVIGILDVLAAGADAASMNLYAFLRRTDLLIHATTHALNALLTGRTACTALLTTAGHPDVLFLREGGRPHFNLRASFPAPYVPRSLTFEIPERIGASGSVLHPLDEAAVKEVASELAARRIEAVAVCLLWSVVNPAHEIAIEQILTDRLPGVPVTLSHRLAPTLREYRRASAAALDASLRPLIGSYLTGLERRLRDVGFTGRLLMVSSSGTLLDLHEAAAAPIHVVRSGPAMQPAAGLQAAQRDLGRRTAIVADTGGTSYDVSLVREGAIPWTRESWVGDPFVGHMIGFPSVDVRSYGAGGGSIAYVDAAGMLHVGPESAGADPGPAAYGRGGIHPTFTDAAVVLGWIDPADFLGGRIPLDVDAATRALERDVGAPLGLDAPAAAAAVVEVITEEMTRAVEDITLSQGVDPRRAVLVGGGGAAGLNLVGIARRLGCPRALVPAASAALSAAGALASNLGKDFVATYPTRSSRFDFRGVDRVLRQLHGEAQSFLAALGPRDQHSVQIYAEAHYLREVWEIEVPVEAPPRTWADVEGLKQAFHSRHNELYAVSDDAADVEFISWRIRAVCRVTGSGDGDGRVLGVDRKCSPAQVRRAFFPHLGWIEAISIPLEALAPGERLAGPAIVTSSITTTVLEQGSAVARTPGGSLDIILEPAPEESRRADQPRASRQHEWSNGDPTRARRS